MPATDDRTILFPTYTVLIKTDESYLFNMVRYVIEREKTSQKYCKMGQSLQVGYYNKNCNYYDIIRLNLLTILLGEARADNL